MSPSTGWRFFDRRIVISGQPVLVSGTYWPGDPGQCSGPPEGCYPPEPDDLDLETWDYDGGHAEGCPYLSDDDVYEAAYEQIPALLEEEERSRQDDTEEMPR